MKIEPQTLCHRCRYFYPVEETTHVTLPARGGVGEIGMTMCLECAEKAKAQAEFKQAEDAGQTALL